MKFILPVFFLLLSIGNLIGQKHAVGVKIGVQFPSFSEQGIEIDDIEVSFFGHLSPRPHLGFFYAHQLTDRLFLEIAPITFIEKYDHYYRTIRNGEQLVEVSLVTNTVLYVPALLRLDLGHQLFLTFGAGSNLFLTKKNDISWGSARIPEEEETIILTELFDQLKPWPVSIEAGLSYGFKRFSINGKFVYRASNIHNDVSILGKTYSTYFRTNQLHFEVSYRLGKDNNK